MKIVVVNGSPRKGNTYTAINSFCEGASKLNEIEIIEANKLNIKGCQGCGACECYKGCVANDDTNTTIDKLVAADMIVWATPVYWWGMTAQIKTVIDKCYCRGAHLKGKKIGIIIVGGSTLGSKQYELINQQFECMSQFLNWEIVFSKSFFANGKDELKSRENDLEDLKSVGEFIV